MLVSHPRSKTVKPLKPFCQCWNKKTPVLWVDRGACGCGEDNNVLQWSWVLPDSSRASSVVMSEDRKQVTFHPFFSTGTAAVKGSLPMKLNHHYYWEVKILSETYGTDIMVGLATDMMNTESQFRFTSLLGSDCESYGFSYTGAVRHDDVSCQDSSGFCRGSIVGVRVDMWHGTLEFYVNRKPQSGKFYNLRRHKELYPMVCSTAAQSSMRLIYADSWRASLLVDAAKILTASVKNFKKDLPPGLRYTCRSQFWLTLPSEVCDDDEPETIESLDVGSYLSTNVKLSAGKKRRLWQLR